MPFSGTSEFVKTLKDKLLKQGPKVLSGAAMRWLGDKAKQAISDTENTTIGPLNRAILTKTMPDRRVDKVRPGEMFFFVYDAKTKDKLPWYDKFPLIFPLEFYPGSMLGMNLHYLEPGLRLKLLDTLMTLKNNDKMDETTKLKLSYEAVKDLSKYVQPTIHRYLYDHVKSKFIKVNADEWSWVVLLPAEKFVNEQANKTKWIAPRKVWKNSNKKI